MPGGRPTNYDPAFCGRVVEMAAEGCSLVEMAAEFGVVRDTLYEWAKVHPEFSDALARARTICQAWWEKVGRTGLVTQGFNAALWNKNVSCRFRDDWTDKTQQELSGPGGKDLVPATIVFQPVAPKEAE
jgi:hypothetical protein